MTQTELLDRIAELERLNQSLATRLHAAAECLAAAALRHQYSDLGGKLRTFVAEFGAMVEGMRARGNPR